jgi:hypothetical protein
MTVGVTASIDRTAVARSVGGVEFVLWKQGYEVWANACW